MRLYNFANPVCTTNEHGASVYLSAALNEVPEATFTYWESQPWFERALACGHLEICSANEKDNLHRLQEGAAIGAVSDCHDEDRLRRWHAAERRTQVKSNLEAKIKHLQQSREYAEAAAKQHANLPGRHDTTFVPSPMRTFAPISNTEFRK